MKCKVAYHCTGVKLMPLIMSAMVLIAGRAFAQTAIFSLAPEADSYVRSLASSSNYGAGGALSVSAASATNSSGVPNGLFDTLMRFSLTNAVAYFDTAFGGQDWVITRVRLLVNEMGTPDNGS